MGWGQGTPVLTTPPCRRSPHVVLLLQSAEPVKRQPRSQCLSTLVRPVFGEVSAGPGVLWGSRLEHRGEGAGPTWYMGFPGLAETTVVLPVGRAS